MASITTTSLRHAALGSASTTRGRSEVQPETVQVWLTTQDGCKRLHREADLPIASHPFSGERIIIQPQVRHQVMLGFGAAIADESIEQMHPDARQRLLTELFSVENGAGLNYMRVVLGRLTHRPTTYDDVPAGENDWGLDRFSIDLDRRSRLPVAKAALGMNPEMRFVASPFTAPAWMKTSGRLDCGWLLPGDRVRDVYVRYLLKWLDAWREEGVMMDAMTICNEPQNQRKRRLAMCMSYSEQADVIARLGRALAGSLHNHVRIWAWDQNFTVSDDEMGGLAGILADEAAGRHIEGVAWHAYSGSAAAMDGIQSRFPGKSAYITETAGAYHDHWTGTPDFHGFGGPIMWHFIHTFEATIRRNARAVLLWNVASRLADNQLRGERPLVRIMPDGRSHVLNGEYYLLAHFSRFVRPGASRIESPSAAPLHTLAFANPDGSMVLLTAVDGRSSQTIAVSCREQHFRYTLPGLSLATFVWR